MAAEYSIYRFNIIYLTSHLLIYILLVSNILLLFFKMLQWLTLCVNYLTHIWVYLQNKFLEVELFGQKACIFCFLFCFFSKAWVFLYRENVCFYRQCMRVLVSLHFHEWNMSLAINIIFLKKTEIANCTTSSLKHRCY